MNRVGCKPPFWSGCVWLCSCCALEDTPKCEEVRSKYQIEVVMSDEREHRSD